MTLEFIAHASPAMIALYVVVYLTACFVAWYFLLTFDYAINGGQLGRHPLWFPFECFAEELPCYWFGGKQHRIEFIRSRCNGDGVFCGWRRSFTYEETRKNNLYEMVFWEMCGGRFSFWGEQLLQFFFGPLFIAILLCAILIGLVLLSVRWLLELMMSHRWRKPPTAAC